MSELQCLLGEKLAPRQRIGGEREPLRTRRRRGGCIWTARVIFPRVQMTCQLFLNYMHRLDQSAQRQR